MKAIHEKQANEKFAQRNNLSIDEMNAKAQEVYDQLDANKFANDDARWARAYRRVRGAFRKKARSMGNAMDGMIVCRMANRDFDRKQYDYAMGECERKGKDEAIAKGLVNKDGQPIYQWGNNKGKVIVDENGEPGRPLASGRAIGYTFEKNDEGEYVSIDPRFIVISKKKVDNTIPICQVGKVALSLMDDSQEGFFSDNYSAYYNDASISNVQKSPYSYDEVNDILTQWNLAFKDHFSIVSSVKDLTSFVQNHAYSKDNKECEYDFCVIPGNVVEVAAGGRYSNAGVTLEFIDYDTLETSILTSYIPQPMLKGLDMQDDDKGIFVLQVSLDNNNKERWHLGGFLHVDDDVDVEQFFGVNVGEEDV